MILYPFTVGVRLSPNNGILFTPGQWKVDIGPFIDLEKSLLFYWFTIPLTVGMFWTPYKVTHALVKCVFNHGVAANF